MATLMKIPHALFLFILAFEIALPHQVAFAAQRVWEQAYNPAPVLARTVIRAPEPSLVLLKGSALAQAQSEWVAARRAPKKAVDVTYMQVSAYNSIPNQTDGSPYHTAIGSMTRDGVVATNYLPIGTRIRFPDLFGDKEFRVEDRMNERYNKVVDIWMEDIKDARKFGRRNLKVEVIEWGKGRGMD